MGSPIIINFINPKILYRHRKNLMQPQKLDLKLFDCCNLKYHRESKTANNSLKPEELDECKHLEIKLSTANAVEQQNKPNKIKKWAPNLQSTPWKMQLKIPLNIKQYNKRYNHIGIILSIFHSS